MELKKLSKMQDRKLKFLNTAKLNDCKFLFGAETEGIIIGAHKTILAMASPVFERMFYGKLAEKGQIIIDDIEPENFKVMLKYIYFEDIKISSCEMAFQLYYAAKKYMLPDLVEECESYLIANLNEKSACRIYEFAEFIDSPLMKQKSMDFICRFTTKVLADPSFVQLNISTLIAIFDQVYLNINSEIELFNALQRFVNEREFLENTSKQNNDANDDKLSMMESSVNDKMEKHDDQHKVDLKESCKDLSLAETFKDLSFKTATTTNSNVNASTSDYAMIKVAAKKIKYQTMTAKEFASGPARSNLLEQKEIINIFIAIANYDAKIYPRRQR